MELILASQSPRRRQLLELMGLQFQVMSAAADEWMDPTKPVEEEIGRVSRLKAEAVLAQAPQGACIIAADTLVCIDGQRLGKPRDEAEAEAMLRRLSGRDHTVMTGVSVLCGDRVADVHGRDTDPLPSPVCPGDPRLCRNGRADG